METEGHLERAGDRTRLRFTRLLRHAPEKVWRALTEPDQLAAWFPDTVVGEFVEGGALRFELRSEGRDTVLTFTDTFDELGKAARDGAGWHVCLDRLGFGLDDTASPADPVAYWRSVHPGYVERFGPEASAIGPPEGHAVNQA